MAKRIPKSEVPEGLEVAKASSEFSHFAEVYIPDAPTIYTYGCDGSLKRGSVVWLTLARRKKPELAVVTRVHTERPNFKLKPTVAHASCYVFSERYMEILEWTARYYLSTPERALRVFWPADFPKFLDAFAAGVETKTVKLEQLPPPPSLTEEQVAALDTLTPMLDADGFRGALLHGVTGSGKTRVYQELTARALQLGKRVLILVPEIGLTPQNAKRFSDFLGEKIVVLHSSLSAPEKRDGWLRILKGEARVVLGTRSAILAPFDFDVVILDEEHDGSYKQQDPSPRYHCRDLAYHVAHKNGALVVLGSATPSLETFANAKKKNIAYIQLKNRATQVSLPDVRIVDMKRVKQEKGILMSPDLREALQDTLNAGNQAILLMNRRGYSKTRVCEECGATAYCKHCHIPLVYHKQFKSLMCHYCGALYRVDSPCPECGSPHYEFNGGAIEKLEEEIAEWVPSARVIRMDRDTTQNVGAAEDILKQFREQNYNVLLGTQMVAKGHDFPGVQLVGVIGAETGCGIPDFRGGERLFQLLSQTAGRAGRARAGGKVILQTTRPEDPVMRYATTHAFDDFANYELEERSVAHYPPFAKLASVEIGCRDEQQLKMTAEQIARHLQRFQGLEILGPADAFIPMVRNVYWVQVTIKSADAKIIRSALAPLLEPAKFGIPSNVEIRLDMDP